MNPHSDQKGAFGTACLFLALLAGALLLNATGQSISFRDSVMATLNPVWGNPPLSWHIFPNVYGLPILLLPTLILFAYMFGRCFFRRASPWNLLAGPVAVLFLLLLFFQLTTAALNMSGLRQRTFLKTDAERLHEFKFEYTFALRVKDCMARKGFHGKKWRATFVSGWDLRRDPFMGSQRALAYYLFPEVDIRDIYREQPVEMILIYPLKDPDRHIGPDFTPVCTLGPRGLVAVKQRGPDHD